MKKRIFAGVVGSMLVTSVGFTAPVVDLQKGESQIGYNYSSLSTTIDAGAELDFGRANSNGFFVEHALSDKVIIGVDYNGGDKTTNVLGVPFKVDIKETDVYAQYKIDKNVRLILGDRIYDHAYSVAGISDSYSPNRVLYGIAANTQLGNNINGYAGILKTSEETEWRIGATYDVSKDVTFDVNYRYKDYDDATLKGVGFGLSTKF